ncbi:Cetn1 [Symbiodinium sp. CCMP2592]|nr:Cetn1 [Symbiodinium sp. CCMP2592]
MSRTSTPQQELLEAAPSRVSRMRWAGLGLALLVTFVVGILFGRGTKPKPMEPSAAALLGALVQKSGVEDLEHHVHKAFQIYDVDKSGHLSMQEFGKLMDDAREELGSVSISHEQLQAVFNQADHNGSGKVEVGEMKDLLAPAFAEMKS